MNKKSILIIEDEAHIAEFLQTVLENNGFATTVAGNGRSAMNQIEQVSPDLMLLDLMLPDTNGLQICRQVRQKPQYVPIIMVTAKDEDVDKIIGLEIGADDYITKPIKTRELLARINAVLRLAQSNQSASPTLLHAGSLVIDKEGYQVTRDGSEIQLRPKEFDLLFLLASHPGKVFGREMLLERIWGYDYAGETRTIDVHIQRLRKKIEPDSANPIFIITVPHFGYKFARLPQDS